MSRFCTKPCSRCKCSCRKQGRNVKRNIQLFGFEKTAVSRYAGKELCRKWECYGNTHPKIFQPLFHACIKSQHWTGSWTGFSVLSGLQNGSVFSTVEPQPNRNKIRTSWIWTEPVFFWFTEVSWRCHNANWNGVCRCVEWKHKSKRCTVTLCVRIQEAIGDYKS